MADIDVDLEQLDGSLENLEASLVGTQSATVAFQQELDGMKMAVAAAGAEARGLSRSLSSGLKSAMVDLVIDGDKLSDVLGKLAKNMADSVFKAAISPVTDALGGALGGLVSGILPFENGGTFSGGRVSAFANGGVVNSPTHFPMRGGVGLMGEAGPEAIMPLTRGADGKLGVRGGGGSSVNVTMNISTPDVAGFQRSRTQIAAGISRAMQRGSRNF